MYTYFIILFPKEQYFLTQIKPINCIFLLALVLWHFFSYPSAKHEYLAAASKYFCVIGSCLWQGFAVQDGAAEKANSRTFAPACTGACCLPAGAQGRGPSWVIVLLLFSLASSCFQAARKYRELSVGKCAAPTECTHRVHKQLHILGCRLLPLYSYMLLTSAWL